MTSIANFNWNDLIYCFSKAFSLDIGRTQTLFCTRFDINDILLLLHTSMLLNIPLLLQKETLMTFYSNIKIKLFLLIDIETFNYKGPFSQRAFLQRSLI